jgi:hypothetical protein
MKAPIRTQSADGVIHEFPSGTSIDTVDSIMRLYADGMKTAYPQWPQLPISSQLNEEKQIGISDADVADWQSRLRPATIILIPPIGVLVVGIGLFWAAVGFGRGQI